MRIELIANSDPIPMCLEDSVGLVIHLRRYYETGVKEFPIMSYHYDQCINATLSVLKTLKCEVVRFRVVEKDEEFDWKGKGNE